MKMNDITAEAVYITEYASVLKPKIEGFMSRFYIDYKYSLVEFKDKDIFQRVFIDIRCSREMADLELMDTGEFYSRLSASMFDIGSEILCYMYRMEEDAEEIIDDISYFYEHKKYVVREIGNKKPDEAFANMYSVMKTAPYTVPETEEELLDFAKMWFDAGIAVMKGYLIECDEEDKDSIFDRILNAGEAIIDLITIFKW